MTAIVIPLQDEDAPLACYNEFTAALAELKVDNKAMVFDYRDAKGNKEARSHVHKLRKTKTAIDAASVRMMAMVAPALYSQLACEVIKLVPCHDPKMTGARSGRHTGPAFPQSAQSPGRYDKPG